MMFIITTQSLARTNREKQTVLLIFTPKTEIDRSINPLLMSLLPIYSRGGGPKFTGFTRPEPQKSHRFVNVQINFDNYSN